MKRLIYAEDVKELIDKWLDIVGYCTIGKNLSYYGELLGCIDDAHTIEVAPVVHGEWKKPAAMYLVCNVCNNRQSIGGAINFCPNCGAKMIKRNDNLVKI